MDTYIYTNPATGAEEEYSIAQIRAKASELGMSPEEYMQKHDFKPKALTSSEPEPEPTPEQKTGMDMIRDTLGKGRGVTNQPVAAVTPGANATDTEYPSVDTSLDLQGPVTGVNQITASTTGTTTLTPPKKANQTIEQQNAEKDEDDLLKIKFEDIEPLWSEGKTNISESAVIAKIRDKARRRNIGIEGSNAGNCINLYKMDDAGEREMTFREDQTPYGGISRTPIGVADEKICFVQEASTDEMKAVLDKVNSFIENHGDFNKLERIKNSNPDLYQLAINRKEKVKEAGQVVLEDDEKNIDGYKLNLSEQFEKMMAARGTATATYLPQVEDFTEEDFPDEETYKYFLEWNEDNDGDGVRDGLILSDPSEEELNKFQENLLYEKKNSIYKVEANQTQEESPELRHLTADLLLQDQLESKQTVNRMVNMHKGIDDISTKFQNAYTDFKANPTMENLASARQLREQLIDQVTKLQNIQDGLGEEGRKEIENNIGDIPIALRHFGADFDWWAQTGTTLKESLNKSLYTVADWGMLASDGASTGGALLGPVGMFGGMAKSLINPKYTVKERNERIERLTKDKYGQGLVSIGRELRAEKELQDEQFTVEEVYNNSDLWGKYYLDSFSNFVPSLIMASAGGWSAMGLFATAGWGQIGMETAIKQAEAAEESKWLQDQLKNPESKLDQFTIIDYQNRLEENGKILGISNFKDLSSKVTYAAAEVVFERLGTMRIMESIKKGIMGLPADTFGAAIKAMGKNWAINSGIEGTTEGLTSIVQNWSDIMIMGKEDVSLLDGVTEAFTQGVLMGGGMTLAAGPMSIQHTIWTGIASRQEMQKINKAFDQIQQLWPKDRAGNPKPYNTLPQKTKDLINEIAGENKTVVKDIMDGLTNGNITFEQWKAIEKINTKMRKTRNELLNFALRKDMGAAELAATQRELRKRYEKLDQQREELIQGTRLSEKGKSNVTKNKVRFDAGMGWDLYSSRMQTESRGRMELEFQGLNSRNKTDRYNKAKEELRNEKGKRKHIKKEEVVIRARENYIAEQYREKIEKGMENAKAWNDGDNLGATFHQAETIEEYVAALKEADPTITKSEINKLIGKLKGGGLEGQNLNDHVIVYMPNAIKNGRTGVFAHELLHTVALKKFGKTIDQAGENLLNYLKTKDKDLYEKVLFRVDQNYTQRDDTGNLIKDETTGEYKKNEFYYEEVMNAMSDVLADGHKIKEGAIGHFKNIANLLLSKTGATQFFRADEASSEGAFNFVRDFNQKAHFGKETASYSDAITKPLDKVSKKRILKDEDAKLSETKPTAQESRAEFEARLKRDFPRATKEQIDAQLRLLRRTPSFRFREMAIKEAKESGKEFRINDMGDVVYIEGGPLTGKDKKTKLAAARKISKGKFSETINNAYNNLTPGQLKTIKTLKSKDPLKELADKEDTLTETLKTLAQEGKGKTKEFTDLNSELNEIKDARGAWFDIQESIRPLIAGIVSNKYRENLKILAPQDAKAKKQDIIENTLTNHVLNFVQKYDPSKLKGAESTLEGYLMQKLNVYRPGTKERISLIEARIIAEASKVGLDKGADLDNIKEPVIEKEEAPSPAEIEGAKAMPGRNTIDRVKLSGELQTRALNAVETTLQTMLPDIGKKVGKNFRNEFNKTIELKLQGEVKSALYGFGFTKEQKTPNADQSNNYYNHIADNQEGIYEIMTQQRNSVEGVIDPNFDPRKMAKSPLLNNLFLLQRYRPDGKPARGKTTKTGKDTYSGPLIYEGRRNWNETLTINQTIEFYEKALETASETAKGYLKEKLAFFKELKGKSQNEITDAIIKEFNMPRNKAEELSGKNKISLTQLHFHDQFVNPRNKNRVQRREFLTSVLANEIAFDEALTALQNQTVKDKLKFTQKQEIENFTNEFAANIRRGRYTRYSNSLGTHVNRDPEYAELVHRLIPTMVNLTKKGFYLGEAYEKVLNKYITELNILNVIQESIEISIAEQNAYSKAHDDTKTDENIGDQLEHMLLASIGIDPKYWQKGGKRISLFTADNSAMTSNMTSRLREKKDKEGKLFTENEKTELFNEVISKLFTSSGPVLHLLSSKYFGNINKEIINQEFLEKEGISGLPTFRKYLKDKGLIDFELTSTNEFIKRSPESLAHTRAIVSGRPDKKSIANQHIEEGPRTKIRNEWLKGEDVKVENIQEIFSNALIELFTVDLNLRKEIKAAKDSGSTNNTNLEALKSQQALFRKFFGYFVMNSQTGNLSRSILRALQKTYTVVIDDVTMNTKPGADIRGDYMFEHVPSLNELVQTLNTIVGKGIKLNSEKDIKEHVNKEMGKVYNKATGIYWHSKYGYIYGSKLIKHKINNIYDVITDEVLQDGLRRAKENSVKGELKDKRIAKAFIDFVTKDGKLRPIQDIRQDINTEIQMAKERNDNQEGASSRDVELEKQGINLDVFSYEKFIKGYEKQNKRIRDSVTYKAVTRSAKYSEMLDGLPGKKGKRSRKILTGKDVESLAKRIANKDGLDFWNKANLFMPYNTEDLWGMIHTLARKGKLGEMDLQMMKEDIMDPYIAAKTSLDNIQVNLGSKLGNLEKELNKQKKSKGKWLNKEIFKKKFSIENHLKDPNGIGLDYFTIQDAVRVYIWKQDKTNPPELSVKLRSALVQTVKNDPILKKYAEGLRSAYGGNGKYPKPENNWQSATIGIDMSNYMNKVVRPDKFKTWNKNIKTIFNAKNKAKIIAAFGQDYWNNLELILKRAKAGSNRVGPRGDNETNAFMDFINDAQSVIMFWNTRSAGLQTISTANYINYTDNTMSKAGGAMLNTKQFAADLAFLWNSDFVKNRRGAAGWNIQEAELIQALNRGGSRAANLYDVLMRGTRNQLRKGFTPTKFADSAAIVFGGATFYRNRINSLLKQGMTEKQAQEKAFQDFVALTKPAQQSSDPAFVSNIQAGGLGRPIFSFANVLFAYNRLAKRDFVDLIKGRRVLKEDGTYMSKGRSSMVRLQRIAWYTTIQNVFFQSLQSAAFMLLFKDDEEEAKMTDKQKEQREKFIDNKIFRVWNGGIDAILRGGGVKTAIIAMLKNVAIERQKQKARGAAEFDEWGTQTRKENTWLRDEDEIVLEYFALSPPLDQKLRKLKRIEGTSIGRGYPSIVPPEVDITANVLSAGNIPADRLLQKATNVYDAITSEATAFERVLMLGGWPSYDLGVEGKRLFDKDGNYIGNGLPKEESKPKRSTGGDTSGPKRSKN